MQLIQLPSLPRRSPKGHEDAFPSHRPNAGYVIGKETVACARGSGRDAPDPVIHAAAIELAGYGQDRR